MSVQPAADVRTTALDVRTELRLSTEEKLRWQEAADEDGCSLSELVRSVMDDYLTWRSTAPAESGSEPEHAAPVVPARTGLLAGVMTAAELQAQRSSRPDPKPGASSRRGRAA